MRARNDNRKLGQATLTDFHKVKVTTRFSPELIPKKVILDEYSVYLRHIMNTVVRITLVLGLTRKCGNYSDA